MTEQTAEKLKKLSFWAKREISLRLQCRRRIRNQERFFASLRMTIPGIFFADCEAVPCKADMNAQPMPNSLENIWRARLQPCQNCPQPTRLQPLACSN